MAVEVTLPRDFDDGGANEVIVHPTGRHVGVSPDGALLVIDRSRVPADPGEQVAAVCAVYAAGRWVRAQTVDEQQKVVSDE